MAARFAAAGMLEIVVLSGSSTVGNPVGGSRIQEYRLFLAHVAGRVCQEIYQLKTTLPSEAIAPEAELMYALPEPPTCWAQGGGTEGMLRNLS